MRNVVFYHKLKRFKYFSYLLDQPESVPTGMNKIKVDHKNDYYCFILCLRLHKLKIIVAILKNYV